MAPITKANIDTTFAIYITGHVEVNKDLQGPVSVHNKYSEVYVRGCLLEESHLTSFRAAFARPIKIEAFVGLDLKSKFIIYY